MVGGMLRHLNSLRRMKRDNGWIETLLEESYNERMHLLTWFTPKLSTDSSDISRRKLFTRTRGRCTKLSKASFPSGRIPNSRFRTLR